MTDAEDTETFSKTHQIQTFFFLVRNRQCQRRCVCDVSGMHINDGIIKQKTSDNHEEITLKVIRFSCTSIITIQLNYNRRDLAHRDGYPRQMIQSVLKHQNAYHSMNAKFYIPLRLLFFHSIMFRFIFLISAKFFCWLLIVFNWCVDFSAEKEEEDVEKLCKLKRRNKKKKLACSFSCIIIFLTFVYRFLVAA